MAHLGSRRRRALALPAGLALTASLGFLPAGAASAAPADEVPAAVVTDGPKLSYVVNVKGGHHAATSVKKAIAKAGGTVVIAYDQIGVIVVHSQNPDFAKTIRQVRGVASAGATRTAPIAPASDTAIDSERPLTAEEAKTAAAQADAGQDPLEPSSGTCPPSRRTRHTRRRWAARRSRSRSSTRVSTTPTPISRRTSTSRRPPTV